MASPSPLIYFADKIRVTLSSFKFKYAVQVRNERERERERERLCSPQQNTTTERWETKRAKGFKWRFPMKILGLR